MNNNSLIVCNCANCKQCDSDNFEFYCNTVNKNRRRIDRGCNLFKQLTGIGSMATTLSGEIDIKNDMEMRKCK